MDIFKLPISLRRCLLSKQAFITQIRRHVSTESRPINEEDTASFGPAKSTTPSSPALLTLSSSTLNSYTTGIAPNAHQLKHAASFFHASPPTFLFSAAHFRSLPPSPFPEVAFLGRSNVGKSSLLNALFGRTRIKDAHVSKRPGRTKTMNGFGVTGGHVLGAASKSGEKDAIWTRFPRGGLVVMDMPGYGTGSREEWGREILKYLEQRKQLRRTFLLIDADHGLKATDVAILTQLRRKGIGHQIILSKADKVLYSGSRPPGPERLHNKLRQLQETCLGIRRRLDAEVEDGRKSTGDILCCSAEKTFEEKARHRKLGVDEIRWAVLCACGLESDGAGHTKQRRVNDLTVLEECDESH